MGKDVDQLVTPQTVEACCEACRHGGDNAVTIERDAPVLKATTPWLVVTRGNNVIREVPLVRGRTTVGRSKIAAVQLDDVALSRIQCIFDVSDRGIVISDSGSTCGTYLDGRKVDHGVVREGSVMLVGNCYMRVVSR
jgi:pSer/pThr/pTyr-binding forkhead associated (FHA) protein